MINLVSKQATCPGCYRVLSDGEYVYECDRCGEDCCTGCSVDGNPPPVNAIVCDECATDEEIDAATKWTPR